VHALALAVGFVEMWVAVRLQVVIFAGGAFERADYGGIFEDLAD